MKRLWRPWKITRPWVIVAKTAVLVIAVWAALLSSNQDEFGFLDGLGARRVILQQTPDETEVFLIFPKETASRVPKLLRQRLYVERHWSCEEQLSSESNVFRSPQDWQVSAAFGSPISANGSEVVEVGLMGRGARRDVEIHSSKGERVVVIHRRPTWLEARLAQVQNWLRR